MEQKNGAERACKIFPKVQQALAEQSLCLRVTWTRQGKPKNLQGLEWSNQQRSPRSNDLRTRWDNTHLSTSQHGKTAKDKMPHPYPTTSVLLS